MKRSPYATRTRKPKTYKYTIELTEPIFPRHLADYMTMQPLFVRQLVSVQDMQRNDHTSCSYVNGDTYMTGLTDPINDECRKEQAPELRKRLLEQVIEMTRERLKPGVEATDAELLGLAFSEYFGINQQGILKTCYRAMEDANLHTANEALDPFIHWQPLNII